MENREVGYSYFCYIRKDLTRMDANMFTKGTKGYCENILTTPSKIL